MRKSLKIWGSVVLSLVIILEILFCIVLPRAVDLSEYKAEIQKLVKEQSQLNLDYESAKITTTPLFAGGISIDNIKIAMPDGSLLFSADKVKTRVSLPHMLLLTVKVSCAEIDKPLVNLEIINNSNFKIVNLFENILNEQRKNELENPKQKTQNEEQAAFNISKIRVIVPAVNFNDYKILITDLDSKHYLDLKGDKLKLGYFNGKKAKIKTFAQLHSDENVNINANVDITSFIPKFEPSLDEEDDPAQKVEIPFVNPVTMYQNYDLKANLYSKLKITSTKNGLIKSYGYVDLEDLSMKIGDIILPKSYLKAKTFGENIWLDTNLNITKTQSANLTGKIKYGKNPFANVQIMTDKIYFNDILVLTRAFLDSLHVRHALYDINVAGFSEANAAIKTNFKKLTSQGYIKIQDGRLQIRDIGKLISDADINLLFDNNTLKISNSQILLNDGIIKAEGYINNDSTADITVNAKKLPLKNIFYAAAPKEIKKTLNFNSGDLTFVLSIKGKLKKALTQIDLSLANLKISDVKNSYTLSNENLSCKVNYNMQNFISQIANKNFVINLPATKSKIFSDKLEIDIDNKNINIKQNNLYFNNNSKLTYSGSVLNYLKEQNTDFTAYGDIDTKDLIMFAGKDIIPYMHYNGILPLNITLNGNAKKQTLALRLGADKNNYITPIDISSLIGENSLLQTIIDFKPNRIKIKNTGLYKKTLVSNEEGAQEEKLEEIIGLDGTIAGDTINLLKISIPQNLNTKLHVFPRSNFVLNKARLYLYGKTQSPLYFGSINIKDFNIPEILTSISDAKLDLAGSRAKFYLNNFALNGSALNIQGTFNLFAEKVFNIFDLKIDSNFIDVDKVMKVTDNIAKNIPQPANSAKSNTADDMPVAIYNGKLNINRLKSGNINIYNILSNMMLVRNVLHLRNLNANIFDGSVNGNISVNLLTSLLKIDMEGYKINVEKALSDAANMKDTLSGNAYFKTNLSLKGATYEEQMKSLKGDLAFSVADGQFGPFGRIENMILAENIRESEFFQSALGGIVNSLATIDTTHFSELRGALSFDNGICSLDELTSAGKILALHVFGNFDILNNSADMKVRAKMTSIVNNLLGPIAYINPVNLLNSAAGLNVVTAKAFSLFCETLTEDEIATLPNFSNKYVDETAMKFQLVVKGDVAKPLTLVKSFKWLATASEMNKANEFVASIPEQQEGSTAVTVEEVIRENQILEAKKQTKMYKLTHLFRKNK